MNNRLMDFIVFFDVFCTSKRPNRAGERSAPSGFLHFVWCPQSLWASLAPSRYQINDTARSYFSDRREVGTVEQMSSRLY